jgi:hypothetical protein
MTARNLMFALLLGSSTPVSSGGMVSAVGDRPPALSKVAQFSPIAIRLTDNHGNFSGLALIAQ